MVLCAGATLAIQAEWRILGVAVIFGLHVFREKPKARFIWYASTWTVYNLICFIPLLKDGLTAIEIESTAVHVFDFLFAYFLMTVCYNGKKGRFPTFSKWFFYIFYPAHILLAWIIKSCI